MADVFSHNTWLYSAEGPRLFQAGESVPAAGWSDAPGKVEAAPAKAPREALVAELEARGVTVDGRWGEAKLAKVLEDAKAA